MFRDDTDRARYLSRLAHYREKFGFRLLAFCLMDNHVHLAVETGEHPLSRIMAGVQFTYTQYFNRRDRRVGHLFQGRYKALIVDQDAYLLALVRYIHENPVEAKLVERPGDYRWSSDRYYRKGKGPEWLDLDVVLRMFGRGRREAARRYRAFMGGEIEEPYDPARRPAVREPPHRRLGGAPCLPSRRSFGSSRGKMEQGNRPGRDRVSFRYRRYASGRRSSSAGNRERSFATAAGSMSHTRTASRSPPSVRVSPSGPIAAESPA